MAVGLQGSGIRATLTPGRQNGLVNMIKTVQASVQEAVQVHPPQC